MIQLNEGNVLLKPSQRKQLLSWLRRSIKYTQRMTRCFMSISMNRCGKQVEVIATIWSGKSPTVFHAKSSDWRDATRHLIHRLSGYLHDQLIRGAMA